MTAEHAVSAIDVHDSILFYVVAAWSPGFDGWLIDYSTFPQQHSRDFTMKKPGKTLHAVFPGTGKEGAIRAGLEALTNQLLSHAYEREDGSILHIEKCLIDAGYHPEIVEDICLHSTHAAVLMPSRGVGITTLRLPMSQYDHTRGDRIGFNWIVPRAKDRGRNPALPAGYELLEIILSCKNRYCSRRSRFAFILW